MLHELRLWVRRHLETIFGMDVACMQTEGTCIVEVSNFAIVERPIGKFVADPLRLVELLRLQLHLNYRIAGNCVGSDSSRPYLALDVG